MQIIDPFDGPQRREAEGPANRLAGIIDPFESSRGIVDPFEQQQPKKTGESGGFFGSLGTALKERFATALPAAKLYTGLGNQAQATEEMLAAKQESEEAFKQTEFSDIGKMFKEGHYGDALGLTLDKFKEVAGSSLGAMAPAMVAGAGAAAAAPAALPAAAIGTAAFAVVSLGSYIADNIGRQKEELKKTGDEYKDINRLSATVAGAGQTALDVIGFKFFKPLGKLVGIEGKESAERAAMEIVEAATKPGAYRRAVAKGTAQGIAFEVPQEVAQQVLERWQAGLPLNPFDDPEAAREYGEAAGGALLLGGPMGAGSKVAQTYAARKSPEGEALLKGATEGSVYDALSQGAADVTELGAGADRAGAEVAGQPSAVSAPGGAGEPVTSGVVSARQPVPTTAEGEGAEPGALAPTEVGKWAARAESALGTAAVSPKYGGVSGAGAAPEAPAASFMDTMERMQTFRDQYESLRGELASQMGRGTVTPVLQKMQRDLAELVDTNADLIGNSKLAQQLKNPIFDGTQALDQATNKMMSLASQGELLPTAQAVNRKIAAALVVGRRDPQAALAFLQEQKQRLQQRFANGEYDANWAMSVAAKYGLTRGEAVRRYQDLAKEHVDQRMAEIDQAIADVGGRRALPSRGPKEQVNLFDESTADSEIDRAASQLEEILYTGKQLKRKYEKRQKITPRERLVQQINEEFGAPVPGEEVVQEEPAAKAPAAVEERVGPPTLEGSEAQRGMTAEQVGKEGVPDEFSANHILATPEGRTIQQFFAGVKSATESPGEVEKHNSLLQNIARAFTEYDIVGAGEAPGSSMRAALSYLIGKFGGPDAFQNLMARLQTMSAGEQSRLFKDRGMPDLTTRRGLEDFQRDAEQYLEQLRLKGEGTKIPTKSRPAPATGEFRGIIPYTEDLTQGVEEAKAFEAMQSGKPRRPEMRSTTKQYKISDTKLRKAVQILRQKIEGRLKLTPEDLAAKTYLDNKTRSSFGDVLRDLAFDLAMFKLDPKEHGANSLYRGEGGAYAERFRAWLENNVDKNTIELLDQLIADQTATYEANKQFDQYVSDFKRAQEKFAEKQRQEYEKRTGTKLPKAPGERRKRRVIQTKVTEAVPETEGVEAEETPDIEAITKNLPKVKWIGVHPSILRTLENGDVKGALEIMAKGEGRYYSLLAQRLLDAGVVSKSRFIDLGTMESLHGNPLDDNVMNGYLKSVKRIVETLAADEFRDGLVAKLESNNRELIRDAFHTLASTAGQSGGTKNQIQTIKDAYTFFNKNYDWRGKYDPNTDEIVLRRASGLTNAVFLHEAVHAATAQAIYKSDTLTGVRKQGFDQLKELYEYSKKALDGVTAEDGSLYGLDTLHEFVAEAMTNPLFQAHLRKIGYKASPYSLWTRFTQALRKLFNITNDKSIESNVFNEVLLATDALMPGGITGKEDMTTGMPALPAKTFPPGRPNSKTALRNLMTSNSWDAVKGNWPRFYASLKADLRPAALGALTMRQMADLVGGRIPQLNNFIREAEAFLARKNEILTESGHISKRWEKLQARDPEMSRKLAAVMHRATISEVDPDPTSKLSTANQRNKEPVLMDMWRELSKDPEAVAIYRQVRDFYEKRYSEYRQTLNQRLIAMRKFGVSEQSINDIRAEFEKARRKGPYFPLMRHGRFWYQVGKGSTREYYMFETQGEMEAHLDQNPRKDELVAYGSQYKEQQDLHSRQSQFLKSTFDAIDTSNTLNKQDLKDAVYQAWLSTQPESSFRNQFVHRQKVAGYSEDALRNFAKSSFHMAYQLSRFEHSPEMFSQIAAARLQLKERIDAADPTNTKILRENNELSDYVKEMDGRLSLMLNPTDVGTIPSILSNIGFVWYLTAPASAMVNVVGGMIIGLPTLVGQQVKLNPNMSYMKAVLKSLGEMKTVAGQIMRTGFDLETGTRAKDYMLRFPSLTRSTELSATDKKAYDLFIADGLIDITATYDQSGLAAAPTESYTGTRHRVMQALAGLFHNAERFNREVMAMSAFRAGMEKRKGYPDQKKAFDEAIAEAKDVTNRSMFDYSSMNKPRYFQHPVARVVLQFKQFPQQMTFFLAHNFYNMIKGASPAVKREATARFVGTMGMAGIFSGVTGLWGFSTVAMIVDAVINGLDDDRDEPFDFELEFVNWANETFGGGLGMFVARGAGNAVGVDLASRTQLDGMWFRDGRKNQDEVEALKSRLIDLLGPSVGLGINAAEAVKLWNEGHADRALEMVAPAFIKNPMIAARYAREGVNTLSGDPLVDEVGPFDLLMQSLGIRPADIAERQYYNITKKGQEQAILKERQNLLNLYGISFMSNDFDTNEKALEKIVKFNEKHPGVAIPADSIVRSIKERVTKSAITDHGLYLDKRMRGLLDESYLD